jgi:biopolymer transport protein ExbD
VTMSDSLAYENLIEGMDALLQSGFPQISISTAAAAQ